MGEGEFALVNEHLTAAIQLPPVGWNPVGEHEIIVLLADIGALNRDEALLTAYASLADQISLFLNHHLYHAMAVRALGIFTWLQRDHAQAEAQLRESLKLFQQLETRWQLGRTLYDLGEISVDRGRIEQAKEFFSQALTAFEEMGARPSIIKTQQHLTYLDTEAPFGV
jgi:tetratricopeptide (TPR) repeat protein